MYRLESHEWTNSSSEDNPASLTDVEMHGNVNWLNFFFFWPPFTQKPSSGSRPPTVGLILQQLLENMEQLDTRMTALLVTTEKVHCSMMLHAEEAERQIKQFTEKLEGLERHMRLILRTR